MRNSLGFGISFGIVCVGIACSAGKASKSNTVASGGAAASAGTLILAGTGGTGTGASGGTSPILTGGSAGMMDAGNDGPVDSGVCDQLNISTVEIVPTVALLVDTSGSMFEPQSSFWDPLFKALMDPTTGVVKQLAHTVRFGFTSYNGISQNGVSVTCPNLLTVPYAIDNYDAINTKYTAIGSSYNSRPAGQKWETPTGEAVTQVAADLVAFVPVPPGPKYILLVTDGNPDTCAHPDPQCGADSSIKAVQDAYKAGIGTFAIGIGDILVDNAGCVGRCGVDHLQDIANAGAGQPVMMNSNEYGYQACTGQPTNEVASYSATGGTTKYYTVSGTDTTAADTTALVDAIKQALVQTRSCTFTMTTTDMLNGTVQGIKITANPEQGMFTYNGTALVYNDPNGWSLGSDETSITINGTTCDAWKKNGGTLSGAFPCNIPHVEVPPPPPPK